MYKSQLAFPLNFFPYRITFDLHHSYTPHFQHKIIHSCVPKTWDTRCLDFIINVNSMLLYRVTRLHNSNCTTYAYNNKYYSQLLFEENPHTAARNSLTIGIRCAILGPLFRITHDASGCALGNVETNKSGVYRVWRYEGIWIVKA